jgi:hypothetical protein
VGSPWQNENAGSCARKLWWISSNERRMLIPVTEEVEIKRSTVQCQPGQKVSKTPSQQTSQISWEQFCHSSYKGGVGRRTSIWSQPQAKSTRPYLKK